MVSQTIKISPAKKSLPLNDEHIAPWKVLVVDDEPDVLNITCHILKDFQYLDRNIFVIRALSLEEAKTCYQAHPDIAVALVDVVMETDDAGLSFVQYVRNDMENKIVQLVLRTGQPGDTPEFDILTQYDINDYLHKSELTARKLMHRMVSYLRAYNHLNTIAAQNTLLEQYLQEKDQLISIVSHELRTPINAISGMSEILLEESDYTLKPYHDSLALINSSSARMVSIIGDLLDTAKRYDMTMNISPADIKQVILQVIPVIHAQKIFFTDQDIIIETNIPDDLPQTNIDTGRIEQVLFNLIGNGLKHGGETVAIACRQQNDSIIVSIRDNGDGMTSEQLEKIFAPFYQDNQEAKRKSGYQGGLGLGLTIVSKIIDLHGGEISVSSKLGEGTEFSFSIPIHR